MLEVILGFQFTVSVPLILGLIITYYVARFVWELPTVEHLEKKAVFISGCDSGFGRALALKCAKAGITVFAGCLTVEGGQSLSGDTKGLRLEIVPLDVGSSDSVTAARSTVKEALKSRYSGITLWAVVCNAGIFTCYGPDDWLTVNDYKTAVEINTFGVIRCVQAFMDLIKEAEGRIVVVSSTIGRVSPPAAGPYAVSKYGVEAYIDCVRQETAAYGVKCSLLEPGAFKTALIDKEAMRRRLNAKWDSMPPAKREAWGREYKEWFIDNWNKHTHMFASSNINIVVNNYFHAITAKYPRCRYLCGLDAVFLYLPFSFLDARIQDPLMRMTMAGEQAIPADLKKKLETKVKSA
ncbi:hypothetical protein PFISCL1PPCAC_611 [Pristionchus fissidentatus]|uniref:Dehydrogenase n=1 Tax=Pristionchus fissidentatus TaxID=1538716 RepID=A0AAV5USN4_9BILA|nr:hypothetical protein PFISCL1PPCAC_611 [Pristionchus fissidentatus]